MGQAIQTLFKELIKWFKQLWFEIGLKYDLDQIEKQSELEAQKEREAAIKPIYIEHPIDPGLQTGESQKLGGAIELKAPWMVSGTTAADDKH